MIDLEQLDNWKSLLVALPATALLYLVAQWLGELITTAPRQRSSLGLSGSARLGVPVEVTIGLNCLGAVGLVTGSWPPALRSGLLIALALVAMGSLVRKYRVLEPPIASVAQWWKRFNSHHLLVAAGLLVTLGPALTYPAGWDELTYHIELPRRWAHAQALSVQRDLPYSGLPSLCECLFTLSYPFEELVTPRLLTWLAWLHGIFVLRQVAGQLTSVANARVLVWAIAASPVSLMVSANCYVEAFMWANVACLALLAVNARASELTNGRRAIAIGLLIGGAMAVKVTSVGLLVLPLLLAALARGPARLTLRQLMIAWSVAAALAFMFYVRPWVAAGNPFSPYFAWWFTSDAATIATSRYHHDLASGNFGIGGVIGGALGPICLAFANDVYDGALGWQWIAMSSLGLLAVVPRRSASPTTATGLVTCDRRSILALLIQCAVLLVLWCVTSQQARFAIPLVVFVMVVACVGLESLKIAVQRWARIGIALLTLFGLPWHNAGYYLDSWLCVLKVRQPIEYLRDGTGDSYMELALYLDEAAKTGTVKDNDKIVSLFEHRLAYLPRQVEIATPYFQSKYFTQPQSETTESLISELRQQQVKYVILTTNLVGPDMSIVRIEDQQAWFRRVDECLASGQLRVVWKSEMHAVVEVVE